MLHKTTIVNQSDSAKERCLFAGNRSALAKRQQDLTVSQFDLESEKDLTANQSDLAKGLPRESQASENRSDSDRVIKEKLYVKIFFSLCNNG